MQRYLLDSFVFMLALTGLLVPTAEAQTKAEAIDSLLTRYHEHGIFNGVVLVADGHEVVYQKGFGYADMTWDILNAPDTRFLIASITKQFTAALILRLAEQGQIDLQGHVTDYLPEYPPGGGDRIKVHHLLSHTSGIPPFNRLPQFNAELKRNPFVPDSFVTFFSGLELEFEPGSDFAYSNSGYYLLGMIAERVTGTTYAEALREYILEPLGLDDTGYYTNSDIIERLAEGYDRTGGDYERAAYFDASIPYSSGMLYSTVGDLFKWDQSLYGSGPFERTETATLFLSPQTPMPSEADDPEEVVSSAAGYGLFFEQVRIGADTLNAVFHDGRIDGFRTMLYRVPTRGQTVVVWDNTDGPLTGDIALYLIALLNGQRAPSPEDLQASQEEPEQGRGGMAYRETRRSDDASGW